MSTAAIAWKKGKQPNIPMVESKHLSSDVSSYWQGVLGPPWSPDELSYYEFPTSFGPWGTHRVHSGSFLSEACRLYDLAFLPDSAHSALAVPLLEYGEDMRSDSETLTIDGIYYLPTSDAPVVFSGSGVLKKGMHYMPLSEALSLATTNHDTLLTWVSRQIEFEGRPLDTLDVPHMRPRYYITQESAERVGRRFVRWPSREPAGTVTLGSTDDQSGYLGLPSAARTLQISLTTLRYWGAKGISPMQRPLDMIKCSASSHIYIREDEVLALKTDVSGGVRRGRPPKRGQCERAPSPP